MNRSRILKVIGIVGAIGFLMILTLPSVLSLLGLHPHFESTTYDLAGTKALIICTSHDTLGEGGEKTGVASSEMTIPYYEFYDSGMQVDVVSIKGGKIPIEPVSLRWPIITRWDKRFLADEELLNMVEHSLSINEVDFLEYDIVFMAGGWGAAYDLGQSEELGIKISEAHAEGKILGSVCHGALGFLKAVDEDGEVLVKGKYMTAVTDKQVEELGISITPLHPETELRKAGADFHASTAFNDFFATYVAVDGNIVTGQNQNSGGETAQKMLKLLQIKFR
jgi:putative intracellular protease/amidase